MRALLVALALLLSGCLAPQEPVVWEGGEPLDAALVLHSLALAHQSYEQEHGPLRREIVSLTLRDEKELHDHPGCVGWTRWRGNRAWVTLAYRGRGFTETYKHERFHAQIGDETHQHPMWMRLGCVAQDGTEHPLWKLWGGP